MKTKSVFHFKEAFVACVFLFLLICLSNKVSGKFHEKQQLPQHHVSTSLNETPVNTSLSDLSARLKEDPRSQTGALFINRTPDRENKRITLNLSSFIKQYTLSKTASPCQLHYLLFGLQGEDQPAA